MQNISTIQALLKAIELAGGQSKLAALVDVNPANVWNWVNRDKRVPPEMVIPVSLAVDLQVTPHELNPKIYPDPEWLPSRPVDDLNERAA